MKCLFCLFCLTAVAFSQQWVVTIEDSVAGSSAVKSIAVDSAGDVYVTGTSERPLAVAVTARVGADGQVKWQRVFDPYTGFAQQGRAIAVDSSGCAYTAVASRDSTNAWCFATVKYLPDGSLAWHERYSDTSHYLDSPKDIALNPKGGCFVTGASGHNSWDYDYVTVSYDPFGTRRWVSTYDGPPHRLDEAYAVAGDYLGNCYVTGSSMDPERDAAVTIKYDSLGNPVWVNELAMPDADISGNDILVTPAGLVYVTGNSTPGVPALLTMKLDAGGDTLWKRTFLHGVGVRVKVDPTGNVYAVGTDDGPDIVVVKYNAAGVLIWSRKYDGPAHSEDWAYDMELGPDSSVYVCGTSRSRPYWNDFFVIKYGYRGDTLWEARLSGNSMYGNGARAMEVDKDGNVIVAGSLGDTVNGTDFVVAKFPPSGPGVAENSTPPVVPQQLLNVFPTVVSRLCQLTVPAGEHQANLRIADITGRTVRGIQVPSGTAGDRASVTWDTRDEQGRPVPNGVYFVRVAQAQAQAQAQAVCKVIVQR